MTQHQPQWQAATDAVLKAERILVVAHIFPDGDAIGALLGLSNALRRQGRQVTSAVDGGIPDDLRFLPGADHVCSVLTEGQWDLLISVDSSDEKRMGEVGAYGRQHSRLTINLDHHPTNIYFGDIFLVESEAVSATQIIYEWLQFMRFAIDREIAAPLLTGLVTDTLGFRTSNVTSGTLRIAQALMDAGASLTEITARTLDTKPYSVIELWKQVLRSVRLVGPVIYGVVTQADLQAVGLTDVTDGGLSSFLVKTEEAMIAAVFKETPSGQVELSFRSKRGYDVAQVAFALGGGGHVQAAGATLEGPLEAALARVLPMLELAAQQGKLEIV